MRFTRVQSSSTDEPSIVGALRRYVEDAGRPFTEVLKREILRNRCEDEVVAKAIEQVLDRAAEVKLVERQVAPTQAVYRAVPRACQLGMAATVSRRDLARLIGYAVPQMIDFRVTGAAEGKYTIRVNGTRFEVAAAGGNVNDVRDQLVIAINAGKEPVTALQRGDDTVRVTGNIAHKAFSFASASTGDALLETRVEADVTNEIKRPITGAGYTDYSAFVDRLVKGAVPSHLAYAAGWYMHKYHGDDVRLAWPSWCKWNK